MKTRIVLFLSAICALVPALSGADLTGKWTGKYDVTMADGQAMNGTMTIVLTQSGSDLTGSVGSEEQQPTPIRKGKVEAEEITFEVQTEGPLMRFVLHLSGDRLAGEANGTMDGNAIKAKVDLGRTPE